MENKNSKFVTEILRWWELERRNFPWRNTTDPYIILVTEILLRKTTSGHVNSIHHPFFVKYPTIYELANADEIELKSIIKPLGLSNQRSKQLIKLAKIILNEYGGEIPANYSDLIKLPGVGKYTSSAVMCNVYNKDCAMVDTNVVKIVGRYFGFKSEKKPAYNDPKLWEFVEDLIPKGKSKEFNLGLIDFVSSFCTSKKPKCEKCPLNVYCNFQKNDRG